MRHSQPKEEVSFHDHTFLSMHLDGSTTPTHSKHPHSLPLFIGRRTKLEPALIGCRDTACCRAVSMEITIASSKSRRVEKDGEGVRNDVGLWSTWEMCVCSAVRSRRTKRKEWMLRNVTVDVPKTVPHTPSWFSTTRELYTCQFNAA